MNVPDDPPLSLQSPGEDKVADGSNGRGDDVRKSGNRNVRPRLEEARDSQKEKKDMNPELGLLPGETWNDIKRGVSRAAHHGGAR